MARHEELKGNSSPMVKLVMIREDGTSMEFNVRGLPFIFITEMSKTDKEDMRVMLGNASLPQIMGITERANEHLGLTALKQLGINGPSEVKELIMIGSLVFGRIREGWDATTLITLGDGAADFATAAMSMAEYFADSMQEGETVMQTARRMNEEFFEKVRKDPNIIKDVLNKLEQTAKEITKEGDFELPAEFESMISDSQKMSDDLVDVMNNINKMINEPPSGVNQ